MQLSTLFIGRQLIRLSQAASTNTYLASLAREQSIAEGFVVITREQTEGRGQRGASWISEPGKNLTLSVLLYPSFIPAHEQFLLSQCVAVALAETVAFFLPKETIHIKWPNDIYVNERKIAGILIENTLLNQTIGSSITGIGLNVNQQSFGNAAPIAVSMLHVLKQEIDPDKVSEVLFSCLESQYLQLKAGKKEQLKNRYTTMLYRLNEWHTFLQEGNSFPGKIIGVDDTGKLMLEMTDQTIRYFDIKEIAFVV
jgi:BirA family transcriptional regulator, biotin operon repressor / biotin---[acetyl-CoA-carboxylase] ligase